MLKTTFTLNDHPTAKSVRACPRIHVASTEQARYMHVHLHSHARDLSHLQGAFPTEAKEAAERTLQQKKKEEDAKMKHLNHTQKRQAMGTARTLSADRKPPFPPLALFSLLSKTCSTATI